MLVLVLVALLAVVLAAAAAGWSRRARSCSRIIGVTDEPREAAFSGDVMCRHVITSGSLAVLEFFSWGIRLRGRLVSRWAVPTWEARYDELAIAELVTLPHSRVAVWLRLRGGQDGIGFMRLGTQEILRQLEERSVPANRAITQVRRVQELYR